METKCECRYTLTLTDQVVQAEFSEMKDNYNHTPSIHEVDEDETDDEEQTNTEEQNEESNQNTELQKDEDNESAYSGDSFCSDESCDESEATNTDVTTKSLNADYKAVESVKSLHSKSDEAENTVDLDEVSSSQFSKNLTSEERSFSGKQRNRRKNMSFTDAQVRTIERENQLLLRKIMAQQRPRDKILSGSTPPPRTSSSAINRKRLQKRIECDNMLLLQRIQQTKSRVLNNISKPGCRLTFL